MRTLSILLVVGCADPEPGGSEGTSDPTTQSPTDTDTDTEPSPTTPTPPTTPVTTAPATDVEPPLGETSGGSGGTAHPSGSDMQAGGADYILIAPSAATGRPTLPDALVAGNVNAGSGAHVVPRSRET